MEIEVTCPCCHDRNATITVDLRTGASLHCDECDAEFTPDDIEAIIESWQKILPWLQSHPARKE